MKLLKYLGILILTLLIVLLSLGLWVKSFEYSSHVLVMAPPEKCWAILHDTSKMKTWLHGFKRLTLKSGEHMHAGASYEIIIVQDKSYVMNETLRAVKAPTFAEYELTNEVLKSEYTITLVPKKGITEITTEYRITGNNLMWKSILFLSKSYLEAESQTQMDLLKLEIETGGVEFD